MCERGEGFLSDPAEQQTGHGDAELGRRDEAIRITLCALHDGSGAAASADHLFDAGRANGDQREFGGDKEAIGEHEQQHQQDAGCRG